mgnify:CR=1 FL=1
MTDMKTPIIRNTALTSSVVVLMLLSAFFCMPSWAQDDLEKPPPIPPEDAEGIPIPPKIQEEQIEPTVTIREDEGRQIEEYRMNGQVYMVKITPVGGIPYYYIDTDGDGKLELDMDQQALNPVQPVHWKILEWD